MSYADTKKLTRNCPGEQRQLAGRRMGEKDRVWGTEVCSVSIIYLRENVLGQHRSITRNYTQWKLNTKIEMEFGRS